MFFTQVFHHNSNSQYYTAKTVQPTSVSASSVATQDKYIVDSIEVYREAMPNVSTYT